MFATGDTVKSPIETMPVLHLSHEIQVIDEDQYIYKKYKEEQITVN